MKLWLEDIHLLQRREAGLFGMKFWNIGYGVTPKMALKTWSMGMITTLLFQVIKKPWILPKTMKEQKNRWR